MSVEIKQEGSERGEPSIVLAQLQRLDGAIEKEFTLIGDRMTWMVVSESFIFGAFVTAAVYYNPRDTALNYLVISLLILLPIIGATIAAVAYLAITAAHIATDRLKGRRQELEVLIPGKCCVELVSTDWATHPTGNVPSRYLPPVFVVLWAVFLVIVLANLLVTRTVAGVTASLLTVCAGIVLYRARRRVKDKIVEWELHLRQSVSPDSSGNRRG